MCMHMCTHTFACMQTYTIHHPHISVQLLIVCNRHIQALMRRHINMHRQTLAQLHYIQRPRRLIQHSVLICQSGDWICLYLIPEGMQLNKPLAGCDLSATIILILHKLRWAQLIPAESSLQSVILLPAHTVGQVMHSSSNTIHSRSPSSKIRPKCHL